MIFVLALGFVAFTWLLRDIQRQDKFLSTVAAGIAVILLSCLWCLLFSRLKWGIRFVSVGLVVVAGAVVASLLEFRTVTGDMIPVFDWKWNVALEQTEPMQPVANENLIKINTDLVVADYPQFLGPNRDVVLSGPVLAPDWSAKPPRQLWRRPIGAGWSGFAIAGTNAVTLEQDGENEIVSCYSLLNGEPVWRHAYPARYDNPVGGVGPRTVPTIVGNRVYTVGATGVLNCLDLAEGRPIWSKNIVEVNVASVPDWGIAGSPLVIDGKVIVSAGGSDGKSLVAYDASSGDRIWSAGNDRAGYSAPVMFELAGVNQIVIFNQPGIASHRLTDGEVLWTYPWGSGKPHVAIPKQVGAATVFFSSGYGVGSELLEIKKDDQGGFQAEQVWRSIRMKAKFNNVARIGGFIYGMDDGIMTCIDLEDGSRRWKEGRYGHGQLISVGEMMLITTEKGDVVLFEPNPDEPRELHRFAAFDHKQWNPPALAGQLLVVRTDREAACYLLPVLHSDNDNGVVD